MATFAQTPAQDLLRPVAGPEPRSTDRHPVRAQDWYSLARPVDQIGILIGFNLLGPITRQAEGRREEAIARTTAGEITRVRRTSFSAGSGRLFTCANCWGERIAGQNAKDGARPGSKHHIPADADGVPVRAILTGANRSDVAQLLPLLDAIPLIRAVRGLRLQKLKVIYVNHGYDSEKNQRVRNRRIMPVIATRRPEHGSGPNKFHGIVEPTQVGTHNFRRLRIRSERRADIHKALLKFTCSLVCLNILRRTERPFESVS